MSDIIHVDFYAKDFMIDTQRMNLEQRGAYIQIMCAILHHQGPVDNDPQWLGNLCNCSTRKMKSLIDDLVSGGFIIEEDGKLSQKRAISELEKAQKRRENSVKNAGKSHEKTAKIPRKSAEKIPKSNKNNNIDSASHQSPDTKERITNVIPKKAGLPDWLDEGLWEEYKRHRRQKKSSLTDLAESRAIAKLARMLDDGHDPNKVIEQSLENGWTGLFELKGESSGSTGERIKGTAEGNFLTGFLTADCEDGRSGHERQMASAQHAGESYPRT